MSPEQLAKSGTEDGEQTAIFSWIRDQINAGRQDYELLEWAFAIPNGGSRGSNKGQAMAVGARLKATGVKAGVSDIFLPIPRHNLSGLFIELKKSPEHGGKPTDASAKQLEFGEAMLGSGYGFCVCCGWREAVAVIEEWMGT